MISDKARSSLAYARALKKHKNAKKERAGVKPAYSALCLPSAVRLLALLCSPEP